MRALLARRRDRRPGRSARPPPQRGAATRASCASRSASSTSSSRSGSTAVALPLGAGVRAAGARTSAPTTAIRRSRRSRALVERDEAATPEFRVRRRVDENALPADRRRGRATIVVGAYNAAAGAAQRPARSLRGAGRHRRRRGPPRRASMRIGAGLPTGAVRRRPGPRPRRGARRAGSLARRPPDYRPSPDDRRHRRPCRGRQVHRRARRRRRARLHVPRHRGDVPLAPRSRGRQRPRVAAHRLRRRPRAARRRGRQRGDPHAGGLPGGVARGRPTRRCARRWSPSSAR